MTGDVVSIFENTSTLGGDARCIQCGHEWTVKEVPVGSANLVCPECHTNRGAFIGVCEPDSVIACPACDNDLFFMDGENGCGVCIKCGLRVQ